MSRLRLSRVTVVVCAAALLSIPSTGAITSGGTSPATEPVHKEADIQTVELTLLGRISDVKGVRWPRSSQTHPTMDLSASVENPCYLMVHCCGGKTIKMRTRPMLCLTRLQVADDTQDLIVQLAAPLEGPDGTLEEKVHQAEQLLADWGAVPNDHMRALLAEMKTYHESAKSTRANGMWSLERVGRASIGEHCEVLFEFWRISDKWNIVAVMSAKQADWEPIWHDARRRDTSATKPDPRSLAEMSAPYQSEMQRFLQYCRVHGIKIERSDGHTARYIIRDPNIPNIELDVYLCAFPRNTSAAEMHQALGTIQLAFPYTNEDAGLAMSCVEQRLIGGVAKSDVSDTERRIAELLRAYHPPAPATTRASNAKK